MKIFVTSDLHVGQSKENDAAVRSIANHVQRSASQSDVLLLGGDYGNTDEQTRECLRLFRRFPGTVLTVPGNHDIWVDDNDLSSNRLVRFRMMAEGFGMHSLHHRPVLIGDVAFVGSLGWYDYSFRDPIGIDDACYEAKCWNGYAWHDGECAKWLSDDRAMTRIFASVLNDQLRAVTAARPSSIIGLIHHVPIKDLLAWPRCFVPKDWRFLNAFLGAERFGELFMQYGVQQVFCGHIHSSKRVRKGKTVFQSIGSENNRKQVLVSENGKTRHLWITSS
ncbi:MAG: metallophosphoesterase [Candidatus Uhrbacteria bacterium]|nr:metallophosphoesterase [Candidatus Uhrbacteria bacterium]